MFAISPEKRLEWERRLTVPMVVLSLVFLLIFGGLIHRFDNAVLQELEESGVAPRSDLPEPLADEPEFYSLEHAILFGGVVFLWPLFFLEFAGYFLIRDRRQGFWRDNLYFLFACFVPPLRIGARLHATDNQLWIPFLGWQTVDRHLRKRLGRVFSVPMIVIALMILPLLAVEYGGWKWAEGLRQLPHIKLYLDIGTAVIWFAFAVEFILMVSVAEKKWLYCARNWVDLVIILLPVIAFLRSLRMLRLARVARLEQLTRLARLYRLRGLTLKAWRAVLLLNVIQRLRGQTLEQRLEALQALLIAKEEEILDLRKEIDELRLQIGQRNALRDAPSQPQETTMAG